MTGQNDSLLPRVIWVYWEQGLDSAPQLVRKCCQSWQELNQDWKLVVLDKESARSYFDFSSLIGSNYGKLSVQHRSDILRLNLLASYGGIWADATCLCKQPLDSWIHKYMASGFFAFRDPGRDRLISNWFMGSLPENHLTRAFCEANNAYWRDNSFPDMKSARSTALVRMFRTAIGKQAKRQDYWFSFLARRILRIYPYFVFHYLFAYHLRRDAMSRQIFESMPYFSARPARLLRKRMMGKPCPDELKGYVDDLAPVAKLTWKKNLDFAQAGFSGFTDE